MKKITIILLIILFLSVQTFALTDNTSKEKDKGKSGNINKYESMNKTYILKHVSPKTVYEVLKPYISKGSYSKSTMMLTVRMLKQNQRKFEELLKKMDIKKKDIELIIYTVIATSEALSNAEPIKNKQLVYVLDKINDLMNFKTFTLDGVSFLPLKDGQRFANLKISSKKTKLKLYIGDVHIIGDVKEGRSVAFTFRLSELVSEIQSKGFKLNELKSETLINTETSIKENGYLVAGVSKIGRNGDSLILVISAKIGK